MDPSSVVKWVNDGKLPAFRTPGGHRRIRSSDLLRFLRGHGMFIPDELKGTALRVVMVDDDRQLLTSMERGMRSHREEIELMTVQSGIEALVLVGAEQPDVLVLDVHMPEMDGLEVCARLKRSKKTQEINIVMMTGQFEPALEAKCLEVGAQAVLPKPFTATRLLQLLSGEVQDSRKKR